MRGVGCFDNNLSGFHVWYGFALHVSQGNTWWVFISLQSEQSMQHKACKKQNKVLSCRSLFFFSSGSSCYTDVFKEQHRSLRCQGRGEACVRSKLECLSYSAGFMRRRLLNRGSVFSGEQKNCQLVSGAVQRKVNIVNFSPGSCGIWRKYCINLITVVLTTYYSTNQPNTVVGVRYLQVPSLNWQL